MERTFKETFGLDSVGSVSSIVCPDNSDHVPALDPRYVFCKEHLEDLLMYMAAPSGDGFYISGPAGSGKTSLVTNACARLGWGLVSVTVGNRTEAGDLIGRPSIKDGQVVFQYGALPVAMRDGCVLLINEVDLMAAGELAALNDAIEGRPLCITQNNGEVIAPSPFFRVVATANSRGDGDGYAGSRVMNRAFLDRFRMIEVDYPGSRAEHAVLKLAAPALDDRTALRLIKFADTLRHNEDAESMDASLSTRTLSRLGLMLSRGIEPRRALDVCFLNRLEKAAREYCWRIWQDIFGNEDSTGTDTGSSRTKSSRSKKESA